MPIQLFISHSERDEELVRPLSGWLQSGLGLTDADIRCTSVSNMAVGSIPAEELRQDLSSAKAVIGLLTANSLLSHWAQLEMGAGWLQKSLHPIRGPGVYVSDLPSPLSDFTTVGYCEKESMQSMLHQLAELLGRPVNGEADQELEKMAESAKDALVADMVRWFSLPPVLSAWRIDDTRYEFELRTLCTGLGLQPGELRTCTTALGVLTRDPDELPMWARDLWSVSKFAVNFMLTRSTRGSDYFLDVPQGVLNDQLIADLKRALYARKNRAHLVRKWFKDAREWISLNPPSENRSHSSSGHR